MTQFNLLIALCFLVCSCSSKKHYHTELTQWQRQLNSEFKDATTSPLTSSDLKTFTGLAFFPVDSTYVVTARLQRTPNEKPFEMQTTTNRLANYVTFGVVTFQLEGKIHQLHVYQNLDLLESEDYKSHLFLPFLDQTNGKSSYSGGRYIDLEIPQDSSMIINFNEAYNPYCAYNKKYSCPIVPIENALFSEIKAGVKLFKAH